MELIGSQVLNAPVQKVWDLILNPDFLAKITPGITRLEKESDDLYKAIADIKMGPVNGKFTGQAELLDKIEPESFTLKVLQKSTIGNVDANIKMTMKATSPSKTELSFEGIANISGMLARTGNRVMSGVASSLTKQFFENFDKELLLIQEKTSTPIENVLEDINASTEKADEKKIEKLPSKTGIFAKILAFLRNIFGIK